MYQLGKPNVNFAFHTIEIHLAMVSRIVPHLKGECPVIPPVHWKGVVLPRQRSSRTLKTLSNCKDFYSLFSAFERLLELFWFDRFFYLSLRDFLNKVFRDSLKRCLNSFFSIYG